MAIAYKSLILDSFFKRMQLKRKPGDIFAVILGLTLFLGHAYAEPPSTIDELNFRAVMDESLFSKGFSLENNMSIKSSKGDQIPVKTSLEIESLDSGFLTPGEGTFESLAANYQSQGLKIKRLSTSWETDSGTLTVGSDWTNFQDFLQMDNEIDPIKKDRKHVSNQVKWLSANGFSISLEDSPNASFYSTDEIIRDDFFDGSPSIILSWQGGKGGAKGEYRVTALGKKLDLTSDAATGQNIDGSDVVGWGLNLEGGWQLGDLFAALSVTFGKGIDSYILQKFGNDILVTPNQISTVSESIGIRPSLYYSLNDKSNFHVALGHYSNTGSENYTGIDNLDTIHMGYSWSPWPSTKFGLELVGANGEGISGSIDDATVKFGAQKRF